MEVKNNGVKSDYIEKIDYKLIQAGEIYWETSLRWMFIKHPSLILNH